jgi:hypothetical protein
MLLIKRDNRHTLFRLRDKSGVDHIDKAGL